jgi:hypothetical protein
MVADLLSNFGNQMVRLEAKRLVGSLITTTFSNVPNSLPSDSGNAQIKACSPRSRKVDITAAGVEHQVLPSQLSAQLPSNSETQKGKQRMIFSLQNKKE